jgi:hypothetical protein
MASTQKVLAVCSQRHILALNLALGVQGPQREIARNLAAKVSKSILFSIADKKKEEGPQA